MFRLFHVRQVVFEVVFILLMWSSLFLNSFLSGWFGCCSLYKLCTCVLGLLRLWSSLVCSGSSFWDCFISINVVNFRLTALF